MTENAQQPPLKKSVWSLFLSLFCVSVCLGALLLLPLFLPFLCMFDVSSIHVIYLLSLNVHLQLLTLSQQTIKGFLPTLFCFVNFS